MAYINMTNAPRYQDFLNITLDMTAQDMADFLCYCWVNATTPNPTILDKWLNSKISAKKA